MIIIERTFKNAEELHEYLRNKSGLVKATDEELDAWNFGIPLWTSPSNFIGCDLIHKGEEVGPITGVHIITAVSSGRKTISYDTEMGNYRLTNCLMRFHNKLYDDENYTIGLHPTRSGLYLWSRGFVIKKKDYKSLYYSTEEYQVKYKKSMIACYGEDRPYKVASIKEKARQSIYDKYGVDWFLSRGSHYSSVTETMISKYGVDNFFYRGDHYSSVTETMMTKYGVENCFHTVDFKGMCRGVSKQECEMVDFLKESLKLKTYTRLNEDGTVNQKTVKDIEEKRTYHVDFMDETRGVIVEFNGDFWHCNPREYEPSHEHRLKHMTAQEIWDFDEHRKQRIEQITGYKVVVVWEHEWANKKEKTKKWLLDQILN